MNDRETKQTRERHRERERKGRKEHIECERLKGGKKKDFERERNRNY